jgi:tetraacyldisaccharide 4'-kinase
MNPLSALFGVGVSVRNSLYDRGILREQRLRGPVVSIGNLCVGGTGKTPFTQLLGDHLLQRGIAFDVLSRGYGRTSTETMVVDPEGTPAQYGDEPLLLARYFASKGEAKVVVGAERFQAGQLAEAQFGVRFHLLDDGFQHRSLHRDFDIVLLAPDDADQVLLPVGRLREPLSALQRADAIVATDEVELVMFPASNARVWQLRRDIRIPDEVTAKERVLAFCGIARPHRFFRDLRRNGIYPVHEMTFRDHHAYESRDVEKIQREIAGNRAECCVTTIKDMMNLGDLAFRLAPIYAIPLTVQLADADAMLDEMFRTIEERRRAKG